MKEHDQEFPSMIQGDNERFLGEDSKLDVPFQDGSTLQGGVDGADEYDNDDDPGFDTYLVTEQDFVKHCKQLADEFDFPARALKPDTEKDKAFREKKKKEKERAEKGDKDNSAIIQAKKKKPSKKGDDELDMAAPSKSEEQI